METLLDWLSQYSAPIVILLAMGATAIYLLKNVLENAISAGFDRQSKKFELLLERRSRFEEKILLDQYELIKTLEEQIGGISTDINRHHTKGPVEDLIVGRDIPRLTDVCEQLDVYRFLIKEDFYDLISRQADALLRFANAKDNTDLKQIECELTGLQDEFHGLMNHAFGIDRISWSGDGGEAKK